MEPIRPDDDEVRTGVPGNKVEERKKREAPVRESAGNGGPGKPAGRSRKASGGGGSGRSAVLLIALLIVAGAAGAGWYQQEQRIQALEGQLEEVDRFWQSSPGSEIDSDRAARGVSFFLESVEGQPEELDRFWKPAGGVIQILAGRPEELDRF